MSNRFKNAKDIWCGGASNPRAVARTLVEAIDQCCLDDGDPSRDAAVRMILDHLCFLCGLPQPSLNMPDGEWERVKTLVDFMIETEDEF